MVTPFARLLVDGRVDVLIHRSVAGRPRWDDLLVPVRGASDVAHSMIDFATQLTWSGRVAVSNCIDDESRRRAANRMLVQVVEAFEGLVETRVARAPPERFLDCSAASRLVSPPTFVRLADPGAEVPIVARS